MHQSIPRARAWTQDVFNTDHEEKLVQGLQRAALQLLREHRSPGSRLAEEGEEEDDGEVSNGGF